MVAKLVTETKSAIILATKTNFLTKLATVWYFVKKKFAYITTGIVSVTNVILYRKRIKHKLIWLQMI